VKELLVTIKLNAFAAVSFPNRSSLETVAPAMAFPESQGYFRAGQGCLPRPSLGGICPGKIGATSKNAAVYYTESKYPTQRLQFRRRDTNSNTGVEPFETRQ